MTEIVFNFFDFDNDERLREDFQPVFRLLFNEISTNVDQLSFSESSYTLVKESQELSLLTAIHQNMISFDAIKEKAIQNYGVYSTVQTFIHKFLKAEVEIKSNCAKICLQNQRPLKRLFLKIDAMGYKKETGIGTILRYISDKMAFMFGNFEFFNIANRRITKCDDIAKTEEIVHKTMLKLALKIGLNVSLHDLPNFYKVFTSKFKLPDLVKNQPFYSYCNSNLNFSSDKFPFCPIFWYKMKSYEMTRNPYIDHPGSICTGKLNEYAGRNMSAILIVMKFAYHLSNIEDIKSVYNLVKNINFPYKLQNLDKVLYGFQNNPFPFFKDYIYSDETFEIAPTLTSNGLCYNWNGLPVPNLFNNYDYIQDFDNSLNISKTKSIKNGSIRKISFILDKHESYLPDRQTNDGLFSISLNTKDTSFDTTSQTTKIEKGYGTFIKVNRNNTK